MLFRSNSVTASYAMLEGGSYVDKGKIGALTGGASSLTVDGSGNNVAAAWIRQTAAIKKEAGQDVTTSDLALQLNGAEIAVSIWDGSTWEDHEITTNKLPDLAPTVAINSNGDVVVAWRSVYSMNPENPTDFTGYDYIMYSIKPAGGSFSAPETLYNGTLGKVMALDSEILSDGSAAITWAIQATASAPKPGSGSVSDPNALAVVYAVIGADGAVKTTQRVTNNDGLLDANPQLTTLSLEVDHGSGGT